LQSWKEIAAFLGREVRTVQLWEKHEGLPVRRHNHRKLGSVHALKSELEEWLRSRSSPPRGSSGNAMQKAPPWHSSEGLRSVPGNAKDQARYACKVGRYYWRQRGETSLEKSLQFFNSALTHDRACADAYAGISDCYVSLAFHHLMGTQEARRRATTAASTAVSMSQTSATSYSAYANVLLSFNWDWRNAQRACARSIEIDPCNTHARVLQSMLYTVKRDDAAAIRSAMEAIRLDSTSPIANNSLASAYYYAGEYRRTIQVSQRTVELQPDLVTAHVRCGLAHAAEKSWDDALTAFGNAATFSGGSPYTLALIAFVYASLGNAEVAKQMVAELLRSNASLCVPLADIAAVHVALNEPDSALSYLKVACAERDMRSILVARDPRFRRLHDKPAFQTILRSADLSA
jgi:tetratricopeptide (TPR) repeat protein